MENDEISYNIKITEIYDKHEAFFLIYFLSHIKRLPAPFSQIISNHIHPPTIGVYQRQ